MMKKRQWWMISNAISIAFLTLTAIIWAYTANKYNPNTQQLTKPTEVEKYLSKNFPNASQKRIPTGVFIQSLKFNNATEVNFTGYIWQLHSQYLGKPNAKIPIGFILPETVESGSNIQPKIVYRKPRGNNQEVIGWYFEATLKQKFDYDKYPFDHKTAWIRFWSSNFEQDTVLIPDFSGYTATGQTDSFGWDRDIVLGHWQLLETYFDYHSQNYNSNFGLGAIRTQQARPELYFNIVLKRRFLNSFTVYILPLAIIACLIFATLMMISKDTERSSIFGMNTSGVIGVCSGLFFVVLVSQVQIREQFAGSRIVYIECFYPMMYIALLGVSINSYLFSLPNSGKNPLLNWINYEDNLRPKLLYWPLLLGTVTVVTAIVLLPENHRSRRSTAPTPQAFFHKNALTHHFAAVAKPIASFTTDQATNARNLPQVMPPFARRSTPAQRRIETAH
ncbi:hypothetical protein IQ266_24490 [filamentous cyanobacterium LEGE 11480]|uniref:Uncharacterized protein n=1 Tax=Romeriopsis navalis LEGE 11480 TaxID=2777977 RepID=A0A928Z5J9_9CYAN|nr:hypothetical protein [Romeriopsis navalis]MBE9032899.1 hypothetical protein [Romeriopsis navalis LEGE 11480]